MFSMRSKRPSSARRNIKQETFSPFVSATRLRHVQSLLQDGSRDTKGFPDAILCISGIDSRYNDGMTELINYLMFGFFDVRKTELEKSGFDEEVIDDILFLIQHDQVDVYCNPINYHYLLPYVSHWRNIFFHCLTETEYEDEEKAEDFKISTFVSLVKNCQKIGIPYSNSGCPQQFDKMAVEKWPLIQVYGVEGVGSGGFFTMQHDVVDFSSQIHKIYNLVDPVALETMVVEQLSRLERQWQTMISTVDVDLSSTPELLTEEKVCEPLKSFYVHGCVGGGGDGPSVQQPYVLFGTNTRKETMSQVLRGGKPPNSNLKVTTIGEYGANIMVCKAVSPRGPLQCTRTYFFHKEFVSPFQDAKITSYEQNKDLRLLTVLYSAMIDGVLAGIDQFSHSLSAEKARDAAIQTVQEKCADIMDKTLSSRNRPEIEFTIESVDSNGRSAAVHEGERSLLVKCATMTMYNIPSCEKSGQAVGSLVFSESFLDSVLRVRHEDSSISLDGKYLLLTDHIPRHQTWAWSSQEEDRKLLESKLESDSLGENFGKLLLHGDPVNIGCSSKLSYPPDEVSLYAFENGLILLNPHNGAIVLHGNHIRSAAFYDGESHDTVAVLVLEYHPTFVPYIPFHLQTEDCKLVLLFRPKSKAYKQLYSEVLHHWREDSKVPEVKRVEELPDVATDLHSLLQHHFATESSNKVKTSLQTAAVNLPHFYSFLDHYTASSVSWDPVPEKDLSSILQQITDYTDMELPEKEIVVTIISGIPGSHQEKLVNVLSDLAKDQNRYAVLKPPLDSTQMFVPVDLQTKLKATLNVHRRRKQTQMLTKNTRVIYVVPGYSDIVSVVQAVECHPDPDVRKHCFIGSVTACVDPLNTFMEHKYIFPLLLNLCAQGWVNQIVMTSSTELKNETLEEIQHMLRAVNNDVAFLLAEQGQISRSMDIDAVLSENSFSHRDKVRARHLICPGWSTKPYRPIKSPLQMKQLRFTLPLDKNKLLQNLKGLKTSLVPYPFSGNIYNVQGKLAFIGESDLKELHYTTMNGALTIQSYTEVAKERSSVSGNFVTFTGVGLEEAKLKDWLRGCAPQKPEKKKLITRKDVTRDEVKKIHTLNEINASLQKLLSGNKNCDADDTDREHDSYVSVILHWRHNKPFQLNNLSKERPISMKLCGKKEHHLEALPAGWFYNGTQFVSFDGSKQDQHPNLEEFISDYMEKKNEIIRAFNKKVDIMTDSFKDLFA